MRVIYLHGFCSSPASSKALRFARELEARGVDFVCPDLNLPAFETLTITRMLDDVRRIVDARPGPVALVGSSLGGFVAIHAAATDRGRRIERLVLMAPAVDFGGNRLARLGDRAIADWRRDGSMDVFHYADNRRRQIGFGLYEDAARYDAYSAAFDQPALVFQGRADDVVPAAAVQAWAADRANVDVRLLEDGHQLAESIDLIWNAAAAFLIRGASAQAAGAPILKT